MSMLEQRYPAVTGKVTAADGSATQIAIAAPGAGKLTRICWGILSVSVAGSGGAPLVSLKDGSTVLNSFPANATNTFYLQWGDQGYPLSTNAALNLVVEGATTQATAQLSITGYTVQ